MQFTRERTRSFENCLYTLMVNPAAPRQTGHSMILDFKGSIAVELDHQPGILIGEIDLDALHTARRDTIYGYAHRRPDLYSPLTDPAGTRHWPDADLPPAAR
jgi:predicted amidohydrolase